jgi:hypothetical protein
LLYFYKIYQFVKKARQKTIANVAPTAGSDISGVRSQAMCGSDPTIVDVVFHSIYLVGHKPHKILQVIQTLFDQPKTQWIGGFG